MRADDRLSVEGMVRLIVNLDVKQCVRTRSRLSDCSRCFQACPFDAISMNGAPRLDPTRCLGCGACLHACPSGALTGNQNLRGLAQCVARQFFKSVIELACPYHPAPQIGPKSADAVTRAETCLAALAPSAYLLLFAQGVKQLVVRSDECAGCPLGQAQPQILETVSTTKGLLDVWGQGERLSVVRIKEKGWQIRPVFNAGPPTISRRDLFRLFKPGAGGPPVSALASEEAVAVSGKQIPPERGRLLGALKELIPPGASTGGQALPNSLRLIALGADQQCTACGVCARICPTGALTIDDEPEGRYRLKYWLPACTDCGLCFDLCAPHALHKTPARASDIFVAGRQILREGEYRSCPKCGVRFASTDPEDLCFVCRAQSSKL